MLTDKVQINMINFEEKIRKEVMESIDLSVDVSDEEIQKLIRSKIIELAKIQPISLTDRKKMETGISYAVFDYLDQQRHDLPEVAEVSFARDLYG